MKRKFFTVLLAACAALFSFTSLTGCGGAEDKSEKERTKGYMTYDNWKSGSKMFKFETALSFTITPDPNSQEVGQDGIASTCYFRLGARTVEQLDCRYKIEEFQNGEKADSTASLPLDATLTITFTGADQLSESDLLAAFSQGSSSGGDSGATRLIKQVTVVLTYNTGGTGGGLAIFSYETNEGSGINPNCHFEVKTPEY